MNRAVAIMSVALLWSVIASADPQSIISGGDAERAVTLSDLQVQGGNISAVLVNTSSHTIHQVELLINHTWLWRDERHPGEDNPGRSNYYTVHGDIAPGGKLPFTYRPTPPLPQRSDGHFETSAQIVGLVEVGD